MSSLLPADPTVALKVKIIVLEGEINAVEEKITVAKQETHEATLVRMRTWTIGGRKKAMLRMEIAHLRDQLEREKEQLQECRSSFICAPVSKTECFDSAHAKRLLLATDLEYTCSIDMSSGAMPAPTCS